MLSHGIFKSFKIRRSQIASFVPCASAMYSVSAVNNETTFCHGMDHEIGPPFN